MMYALITMPLGIPLKLAPSISLPGGHATTLTSQGPERSSATCTEPGKLKLVINTCTQNAAGPMAMIQRTLEQVGFACWSDVIVVEGNADDEAAPAPMAAVNTTGVHTMTLIRTSKNNYDFHAYSALYKYREDPTVKAPSYLYMHDTCIPNPYFVDRFNAIATELDGKPKEILAVTKLQSNIYAFGSDVVEAYQHNFDPQIESSRARYKWRGVITRQSDASTSLAISKIGVHAVRSAKRALGTPLALGSRGRAMTTKPLASRSISIITRTTRKPAMPTCP